MSKRLKYFILTVLLLLAILIIAPFFIPASSYKETIRSEVKKATGLDLIIDGDISLSVLPRPSVKLTKLTIPSPVQAQAKNLIELDSAKVVLSLTPLLTGKIEVANVELDQPVINLETLQDGTGNWELPKTSSSEEVSAEQKQQVTENPKAIELPILLSHLKINNGHLQHLHGKESTKLEDINISLDFASTKGPIDFTTDFQFSGKKLELRGVVKELANILPITAEIHAMNQKIAVEGELNLTKMALNGALSLQGNLKSLLNTQDLPKGMLQDYKLEAKLYGDKEKASLDAIALTMGTITGGGKLDYNIKSSKGNINLDLNPGVINVKLALEKMAAQLLESSLTLQAQNPQLLLNALEIDTKKLPKLINQELSLTTNVHYAGKDLSMHEIAFKSDNVTLYGMLEIKDLGHKASYVYDLKTDSGLTLAKLFNVDLPLNITDLKVKGNSTLDGDQLKTDTQIFTAKSQTHLAGEIGLAKGMRSSLHVDASGNSLAQSVEQLYKVSLPQTLGNFKFSTLVQGDFTQKIEVSMLDKSSIQVGNENVTLKAISTIIMNAAKPKIALDMNLSALNLNYLAPVTKNSQPNVFENTDSPPAGNTDHWSAQKIDLTGLSSLEGDFVFAVQKLTQGSLVFDNIKVKAQLSNGIFKLDSLTGNLYGGELEGSGSISSQADRVLSIKLALKNAHLKNIVPHHNEFKVTQGLFSIAADLNSKGESQLQYINNLSGNINFNGADGKISGADLQKVLNALTQVKDLNGILHLLDSSFSGGETSFKNLTGKVAFDKGVGDLQDCKLEAQGATATAVGKIDLPNYSMDVMATVNVDIKNMPPFKARLYGALDNPSHKLDTGVLKEYLVKNVVSNVIDNIKSGNNKPEELLKSLIGIGGKNKAADPAAPANPTPVPETTEPKQKPIEKLINKGLNELFKKH